MGLMDKVKAQATQLAQKTQETAREGKARLDQAQANRRADALLRNLGALVYSERTGRAAPDSQQQLDKLVAEISAHEAENGINLARQATDTWSAGQQGQTGPPAGPQSFTDPGAPAGPAADPASFPDAGTTSFPDAGPTTVPGTDPTSFPDAGSTTSPAADPTSFPDAGSTTVPAADPTSFPDTDASSVPPPADDATTSFPPPADDPRH